MALNVFLHWGALSGFVLLSVWAMVSDCRALIIDNWVSVVLALLFLPAAFAVEMAWASIGWHYGVGLAFLVGGFVLFALNIIGGGDVKFAAATAIWMGPDLAPGFLFLFAVLGGVLAAVGLIGRKVALPAPLGRLPWLGQGATTGIPYGIALGLAGIYGLTRTPVGAPLRSILGL